MTENNNRGVLSGISEWLARIDQSLDEIEQKDSELKEDDSVAAAKDSNDATSHLQHASHLEARTWNARRFRGALG